MSEPPVVEPREAAPEALPDRCPRCGTPHEPYQEYCLECGERLPPAYPVREEVWWRRSPYWFATTLLALLVLTLAATVLALLLANRDAEGTKVVQPARTTTPLGNTALTGSSTGTLPATITTIGPTTTGGIISTLTGFTSTTTGFTSTTTTGFPTTTTTATTSGLATWPPGRSGYTIILQSDPRQGGRSRADATAREAQADGLPRVGILDSSDFSSLRDGYWVVFSGIYDSETQARAAVARARTSGFPDAYPRQIDRG